MRKTVLPWSQHLLRSDKPTVGNLVELCEENYCLLLKLCPLLAEMSGKYHSSRDKHLDLYLEILEQTPYTTLIHLTYFFDYQRDTHPEPDAMLRIYHDSQQVEVIDLKQKSLPVEKYFDHPGLLMKWRVNLFLSKWLVFCIHQGHEFNPRSSTENCCLSDIC